MDKYTIDGFNIKSGRKDLWFHPSSDDEFSSMTLTVISARIKPNTLNKIIKKAYDSSVVSVVIELDGNVISFNGFIERIECTGRKTYMTIRSSGEITTKEDANNG